MNSDKRAAAEQSRLSGKFADAVGLAWIAIRPAVLQQDGELLQWGVEFGATVAAQAEGETRIEAERLSAYCAACLANPRDTTSSGSIRQWFARGRARRKTCPSCHHAVDAEALFCSHCGHEF